MLVREHGQGYQIVLQPDHGLVAGQLALAWRAQALSPALREALILASARHDDGWAIWERNPTLDADGRPHSFLTLPLEVNVSSYSASAEVMAAEHPAAGLLASMHVSGLQRNRYGVMGGACTPVERLSPLARELVTREERRQEALRADLAVGERELWHAYRSLQVFDTFSLYLGLADLERGEGRTIPDALELAPVPDRAWTVACRPYPFRETPAIIHMRRRLLSRRHWDDLNAFRADFAAAESSEVAITLTR